MNFKTAAKPKQIVKALQEPENCKFPVEAKRAIWQYGLWSFQTGGTKLERFLPKNQHTQRKLLNFENWINGKVSQSVTS